jgi:hypothetical protein
MGLDPTGCCACSVLLSLLRGVLAGLIGAGGGHLGWVLLVSNFHVVVPGQVYRSHQPSAGGLRAIITKHNIRTVVNLRGFGYGGDWYRDEARVTCALGASQEDLGFSAVRLPSTTLIRQLIEVIDRSRYPVLFHCYQGADRTGLAVVVWFLLQPGVSFAEARSHLGPSTGHLPVGRTRWIDRFFDLYLDWLAAQGREHSPQVFREWANRGYCPEGGRAEFTLLSPVLTPNKVLRLRTGEQSVVTIHCKNTSIAPWRMQPGLNAGVFLTWHLLDAQDRWLTSERAGLFDRVVQPGAHVDVSFALPALPAGRFQLRVDMMDSQQGSFLQLGNDPLLVDVEVS